MNCEKRSLATTTTNKLITGPTHGLRMGLVNWYLDVCDRWMPGYSRPDPNPADALATVGADIAAFGPG